MVVIEKWRRAVRQYQSINEKKKKEAVMSELESFMTNETGKAARELLMASGKKIFLARDNNDGEYVFCDTGLCWICIEDPSVRQDITPVETVNAVDKFGIIQLSGLMKFIIDELNRIADEAPTE